jgi:hypothetical protein
MSIKNYLETKRTLTFQVLSKPEIYNIHCIDLDATTVCTGDNCEYCLKSIDNYRLARKKRCKIKIRTFIDDIECYDYLEDGSNLIEFLNGDKFFWKETHISNIFTCYHPIVVTNKPRIGFRNYEYSLATTVDAKFCYPFKR